MDILIVGNILKDVYLRVDSRTEAFERDSEGVDWLNLGFNAEPHHFFSRFSNFGGAAVSLEVLQKLGLKSQILGSSLSFTTEEETFLPAEVYRYILASDDGVTYFTPSKEKKTEFTAPKEAVDYLYIDRSACLDEGEAKKILVYLSEHQSTKLVLYVKDMDDLAARQLMSGADLIFLENNRGVPEFSTALPSFKMTDGSEFDPAKIVIITENELRFREITEQITVGRVDLMTHLSVYSTAAATVLGSFVLGKSVEESLKLAKFNVENSTLNAALSLGELTTLAEAEKTNINDLELIAAMLTYPGRGILAADESGGSIKKKFAELNIPDTFENRHSYRDIFLATPELSKYVNGVILFDETARDIAENGENYTDFLIAKKIVPGIKVDKGLVPFLAGTGAAEGEKFTDGLDGLSRRLLEYYQMGLRFAKWRAAFELTLTPDGKILTPTNYAITENCRILAEYAKTCQSAGLVSIVEPEVVHNGDYSIEACAEVTGRILVELFKALNDFGVNLKACILKVNMVLAGKKFGKESTPEAVGRATAEVLKKYVPEELAGVVFLSGGQSVTQATENLAAVTKNGPFPWPVTFSFARALQDPALYAWAGDNRKTEIAREAFLERLVKNTEALEK